MVPLTNINILIQPEHHQRQLGVKIPIFKLQDTLRVKH
jgi:hypothetical protein